MFKKTKSSSISFATHSRKRKKKVGAIIGNKYPNSLPVSSSKLGDRSPVITASRLRPEILFTKAKSFFPSLRVHRFSTDPYPRTRLSYPRLLHSFPSSFPIIYTVFLVYLLSSKRADSRYDGTRPLEFRLAF